MFSKRNYLKIAILTCILFYNGFSVVYAQTAAIDAENSVTVANELNALYNKTDGCQGNDPDYYCSGVMLHTASFEDVAEPWYLPDDRDVGSFSYLRNDIVSHIGYPVFVFFNFTGFILTPSDELKNAQYPYEVYCSYPLDAHSFDRTVHGCGDRAPRHLLGIDYSNCADKGVTSIDTYMAQFTTEQTINVDGKSVVVTHFNSNECSFAPDKTGFKLSMDLAKYLVRDNPAKGCEAYASTGDTIDCMTHNELVVSTWPKNKVDASQIPIKAFFVIVHSGITSEQDDKDALLTAFKVSANFRDATNQNRHVPVVILDMKKIKNGSKDVFSPAIDPSSEGR